MPTVSNANSQSVLSQVRASNSAVYLNNQGQVSTGRSLKGALVSVAESLGIFKDTTALYRADKALDNRNAYKAAWQHVENTYGFDVAQSTKQAMADRGYTEAFPFLARLKGKDISDPSRTVTGREIRNILDTAHGLYLEQGGSDADLIVPDEPLRQQERFDPSRIRLQPRPQNREPYRDQVANIDDIPESLWDPDMWTQGTNTTNTEVTTEADAQLTEVPKELARAMVADNQVDAKALVQDKERLAALATKLGFDTNAIAERSSYVETKLLERIANDPRAQQSKLTTEQFEELAANVFEKAMGKSVGVANIKGAMRGAKHKLAETFGSEVPKGKVDVIALSQDKVRAACTIEHLKELAAELPGTPVSRVKPARLPYITQTALNHAERLVAEKQTELTDADVDQVLKEAIGKSLERGVLANRFKGVTKHVQRATRLDTQMLIKNTVTVREELAEEQAARPKPPKVEQTVDTPVQTNEPQAQATPPSSGSTTVESSLQGATATVPTAQTTRPVDPGPAPKPAPYKGVDFFSLEDKRVRGLSGAIKNHQRAKQVVADDRFLEHALHGTAELDQVTPTHREYMKTTLLKRVDEFQRLHPTDTISEKKFHEMLSSVASRAFEIEGTGKLKAKMLGKKMVKHLGKSQFERDLHDLQKRTRSDAKFRFGKPDFRRFMREAARAHHISIDVPPEAMKDLRPAFKNAAEAFVVANHTRPNESDWQNITVQALRNAFTIVER